MQELSRLWKKQPASPKFLFQRTRSALAAALVKCGSYRPLICAATTTNYRQMCTLAKQHGCRLVVWAPTLEGLAQLTRDCAAEGVPNIVMDPAPQTLGDFIYRSTAIRQLAITRVVPELGNRYT